MVVVVTGASAGVGRAVVRELARHGSKMKIGLLARGTDGLLAAKKEVEALGGRAIVVETDISEEVEVEAAAARVERELGPIDIWINDAMVSVFAPVSELTPNELRRVTDVTYLGTVWCTLAALRRMKERNRGVIVQVGSALAYRAIPLQAAYCAAKHAVKGFTESLRTELLHEKSRVQVVMVELPAVNTPQFDWSRSRMPRQAQPVPPIYQPEVIARAIVHAAFHPRKEVIVGFPAWKAIFAEKWTPALADRFLAKNGYDAQMTDEPSRPHRLDDLWRPLPGDHGAHGRFDARAKKWSLWVWLNMNRRLVTGALAAMLAGAIYVTKAPKMMP